MGKYKTEPIGEIFKFRTVKLQVVEKVTCSGCYLRNYKDCKKFRSETGYCGEYDREDEKSVMFKLIDNK